MRTQGLGVEPQCVVGQVRPGPSASQPGVLCELSLSDMTAVRLILKLWL